MNDYLKALFVGSICGAIFVMMVLLVAAIGSLFVELNAQSGVLLMLLGGLIVGGLVALALPRERLRRVL